MSEDNGNGVPKVEFGPPIAMAMIRAIVPVPDGCLVHLMDGRALMIPGALCVSVGKEPASPIVQPNKRLAFPGK
jgi:hypothetical protein